MRPGHQCNKEKYLPNIFKSQTPRTSSSSTTRTRTHHPSEFPITFISTVIRSPNLKTRIIIPNKSSRLPSNRLKPEHYPLLSTLRLQTEHNIKIPPSLHLINNRRSYIRVPDHLNPFEYWIPKFEFL